MKKQLQLQKSKKLRGNELQPVSAKAGVSATELKQQQIKFRNKMNLRNPDPDSDVEYQSMLNATLRRLMPNTVVTVWEYANLNLTTDVSGNFLRSISFTRPNTSIGILDWTNWAGIFDSYRVLELDINYVPRYPYDTSTTTPYSPLLVYVDVDSDVGSVPTASWSNALAYLDKRHLQPWRVYRSTFRVPRYTSVSNSTSVTVSEDGWFDILSENSNSTGSLNIINYTSFTMTASTTYGWFTVGWKLQFANKR